MRCLVHRIGSRSRRGLHCSREGLDAKELLERRMHCIRRTDMNTQVVLITGALTGIGRATAFAFAEEGARIVISGRREEEGKKLVAELRKLGAEVEFARSDVRHEEDLRSLVDKDVARFGRLDAAVNCAGTEGKPGPVAQKSV